MIGLNPARIPPAESHPEWWLHSSVLSIREGMVKVCADFQKETIACFSNRENALIAFASCSVRTIQADRNNQPPTTGTTENP
jgi:hypothetical protein